MIGVLGISHKSASQDIRGKFSFSKEEIIPFGEYILQETDIKEVVILSTCNRTEIYFYLEQPCCIDPFVDLSSRLHAFKHVEKNLHSHFYTHLDKHAVNHLFEVTSGVDSMVIGEDQIVGQVKEAFLKCTESALTDVVLMRLFQKSFETGKRVRTETDIQLGATSISYVAVDLCSTVFNNELQDKKILFVGAGETGRLALENIKKRGAQDILITNRTHDRAENLARDFKGKAVGFHEYHNYIQECDIVIVATSSKDILINNQTIVASQHKRKNKTQVLIDLSVPRNIDKDIIDLPGIKMFGVDDCQDIIDSNTEKRKKSVKLAHVIIHSKVDEYFTWFESLTLRPLIKAITSNMHKIKDHELAYYKRIKDPELTSAMDEYADHLTEKYIKTLIKNLKVISKDGQYLVPLKTIQDLFTFEL